MNMQNFTTGVGLRLTNREAEVLGVFLKATDEQITHAGAQEKLDSSALELLEVIRSVRGYLPSVAVPQ